MEAIPMKVFNVIVKIVIALAAIAGAIYVAATYGDKIVAWAKKLLNKENPTITAIPDGVSVIVKP